MTERDYVRGLLDRDLLLSEEEFSEHINWYPTHLSVIDEFGNVVPFELRPFQRILERVVCEKFAAKEPCYLVILKCRQPGVSTWVAARFYKDSKTFTNRRSMVLAQDDKATKNVLEKVKFFHKTDPERLDTEKDSAATLKFKDHGSEFMIYTAGSRTNAGRSFSCQAVQFSEYDRYVDPGVFPAVMQVTPNGYPTLVVIESTALGPDGPMDVFWARVTSGRSEFIAIFHPWFDDERYRRPISWDDLLRYAAKDWVAKNRDFVKLAIRKHVNAVKENKNYWRKKRRKEEQNGLGEAQGTAGGPEGLGAGTSLQGGLGGGGEAAEAGGEGGPGDQVRLAGGEVEGEGAGGGGRIPPVPIGWQTRLRQGFAEEGRGRASTAGMRRKRNNENLAKAAKKAGIYNHSNDKILKDAFLDSLSAYEKGLMAEFPDQVTLDAINWLRWVTEDKCNGSEIDRAREFPSRPEEAFSAAADSVLDPVIIAKWTKWAKENPPEKIRFEVTEDRFGRVTASAVADPVGHVCIWERPIEGENYVMGVDPSTGSKEGDWTVGSVLSVSTGHQVAEFRARMDPDLAIDQIEALGVFYNSAFTGVEANTYGIPFVRALEDRGTLPMFEREIPDRREPGKTNKLAGWLTTPKSRNLLFTELRKAVREDRCQIKALDTLRECLTLTIVRNENKGAMSRLERIEARSGCHDDGPMAHGIAIIMRNRVAPVDETQVERKPDEPIPKMVQQFLDQFEREGKGGRIPLQHRHTQVSGIPLRIDGRRSVL